MKIKFVVLFILLGTCLYSQSIINNEYFEMPIPSMWKETILPNPGALQHSVIYTEKEDDSFIEIIVIDAYEKSDPSLRKYFKRSEMSYNTAAPEDLEFYRKSTYQYYENTTTYPSIKIVNISIGRFVNNKSIDIEIKFTRDGNVYIRKIHSLLVNGYKYEIMNTSIENKINLLQRNSEILAKCIIIK